jgi:hypothetical protein
MIVVAHSLTQPHASRSKPKSDFANQGSGVVALSLSARPRSAVFDSTRLRPCSHVTRVAKHGARTRHEDGCRALRKTERSIAGKPFPDRSHNRRAAVCSPQSSGTVVAAGAMVYDIKWIIPKLRNPSRLWNIASSITFAAVGIFSKIIIGKSTPSRTPVHARLFIGAIGPKTDRSNGTVR